MQITVDIPDEIAAQVQARGLTLDAYVQDLIASEAAKPKLIRLGPGPYTPEEAARSIRERTYLPTVRCCTKWFQVSVHSAVTPLRKP